MLDGSSFARRLLCYSAGLAVSALVGALPAPAEAESGASAVETEVTARIEERPCPFSAPANAVVQCMMAWVPASYAGAEAAGAEESGEIGVGLVLLGNFVDREEPDPLVFLTGGPGQAGHEAVAEFAAAIEIRHDRGVLLVDQRGTGMSEPRLDCPDTAGSELDDYPLNDPSLDPEESALERLRDCHRRLTEAGYDLSTFDTRAIARDLRAIRRGLGLTHWNVMGTSYGTRVALEAMRVDPDGIRSVVLNSTLPVAAAFDDITIRTKQEVFEALFANCQADSECRDAFPDLRGDFEEIAAHLGQDTLSLYLRDPQTKALMQQQIGWSEVIDALYQHMAFAPTAAAVPRYIHELAEVTRGRVNLNDDEVARIFQANAIEDELAMGMHLSVRCREDFPGLDDSALEAAYDAASAYYPERDAFGMYREVCPFWDAGTADPAFHKPVASDIPVLMLAGDVDTLTPLEWARQVKQGLTHARLVVFHGVGHDVHSTTPCARAITANFLDDPSGELDTSCAEPIEPAFALEQD